MLIKNDSVKVNNDWLTVELLIIHHSPFTIHVVPKINPV